MKIQLKRSNQLDQDQAKAPIKEQTEFGELCVNYNFNDATLFIKDSSENIKRVAGSIQVGSSEPDDNTASVNWYVNGATGQLYYRNTAAGTWIEVPTVSNFVGGDGINISANDGTVTVNVELAGGQDGLEIDANGKLSATVASPSNLGSVIVGSGLTVDNTGVIAIDTNNPSPPSPDGSYGYWSRNASSNTLSPRTASDDLLLTGNVSAGTATLGKISVSDWDVTSAGVINLKASNSQTINFYADNTDSRYNFYKTDETAFAALDFSAITQNRAYEFPNAGGTIALVGDIPVVDGVYVKLEGDTTAQEITGSGGLKAAKGQFDKVTITDSKVSADTLYLASKTAGLRFKTAEVNSGYNFANKDNSASVSLRANLLTGFRAISFPDSDGTIALTSDIGTGTTDLGLANRTSETLTITSSTGNDAVVPGVNETQAGLISADDKSKLDNIQPGAQANVPTDLSIANKGASTLKITSSTGNDATVPTATTTQAGLLGASDKSKLDGIQSGAEANVGTNISMGYNDSNVIVKSSTGNNGTMSAASTSQAGVMSKADKSKLNGISNGAQQNVNADWNAASGDAEILNKPTVPAAQVNSDWNATSGVEKILNKPAIPASQVNSDWDATSGVAEILNKPTIPDPTNIIGGNGINVTDSGSNSTVKVDLASKKGLLFTGSKLAVNAGSGLQINASTGALETAGSMVYKGQVDLTSATVPSGAASGWTYSNNAAGTVSTEWGAVITSLSAGDTVQIGDQVIYNGASWDYINVGGAGGTNITVVETATDVEIQSSSGSNDSIEAATSTLAGVMLPADRTKLDNIEAGAEVNVGTNLGISQNATSNTITSSTGTNAQINEATDTKAGLLGAADHLKLDGIESGAEANVGTDLSVGNKTATNLKVNSSTGNAATIPAATTTKAGLMSAADKTAMPDFTDGGGSTLDLRYLNLSASAGTQVVLSPDQTEFLGDIKAIKGQFDNITIDEKTVTSSTALILSAGGTGNMQFKTKGNNSDYLFYNIAGKYGTFRFNNLGANRIYTFPNKAGTIALLGDITDYVDGEFVKLVGDGTIQEITGTGGLKAAVGQFADLTIGAANSTLGEIKSETGGVKLTATNGDAIRFASDNDHSGYLFFQTGSTSIYGNLRFGTLTQTRNYDLPNKGGTIAMTSDITDASGDYVKLAGDTSTQEITGDGGLKATKMLFGNYTCVGNSITSSGGVVLSAGGSGNVQFKTKSTNSDFRFYNTAGLYGTLRFNALGANRTYTFPNQAGTIALTSDITDASGDYVKLAGDSSTQEITGDGGLKATQMLFGNYTCSANNITSSASVYIEAGGTSAVHFKTKNVNADYIFFQNPGGGDKYGALRFKNLTANRFYSFPDKAGTIALLSDITDATAGFVKLDGGATQQYITGAGGIKTDKLVTGLLTLSSNSIKSGGQFTFECGGTGRFVFKTKVTNGDYRFYQSPTTGLAYGNVRFNLLTANRNYQFPDAGGTIALTSDAAKSLQDVTNTGNTTTNDILLTDTNERGTITLEADSGNATLKKLSASPGLFLETSVGNNNATSIHFHKARGGNSGPTTINSNDTLGSIKFKGYNGSAFEQLCSIQAKGLVVNSTFTGQLIYDASYHHLFRIDGTEQMRIANNGSVGIGTQIAPRKLSVKGDGIHLQASQNLNNAYTRIYHNASETVDYGLQIKQYGEGADGIDKELAGVYIGAQSGGTGRVSTIQFATGGDLATNTNASPAMTVAASGNVGIGTESPQTKLQVNGKIKSSAAGFEFPDGTTQTSAYTGALVPIGIASFDENGSNLSVSGVITSCNKSGEGVYQVQIPGGSSTDYKVIITTHKAPVVAYSDPTFRFNSAFNVYTFTTNQAKAVDSGFDVVVYA